MALSKDLSWCLDFAVQPSILLQRVSAPFQEIAGDVEDSVLQAVQAVLCLLKSPEAILTLRDQDEEEKEEDMDSRSSKALQRLGFGTVMTLLSGPSHGPVVLCGLAIPTKVILLSMGGAFLLPAVLWGFKHPSLTSRGPMRFAAMSALLGSALYTARALILEGPWLDSEFKDVFHPGMMWYELGNLVMNPLIIGSIGFTAGLGLLDPALRKPAGYISLQALLGLSVSLVHGTQERLVLVSSSFVCAALASSWVDELHRFAAQIDNENGERCRTVSDMWIFSSMAGPFMQLFSMSGVLPPPAEYVGYCVLDLCKLGCLHLNLKNVDVLRKAIAYRDRNESHVTRPVGAAGNPVRWPATLTTAEGPPRTQPRPSQAVTSRARSPHAQEPMCEPPPSFPDSNY